MVTYLKISHVFHLKFSNVGIIRLNFINFGHIKSFNSNRSKRQFSSNILGAITAVAE